jgi:hypothetical protein
MVLVAETLARISHNPGSPNTTLVGSVGLNSQEDPEAMLYETTPPPLATAIGLNKPPLTGSVGTMEVKATVCGNNLKSNLIDSERERL